jgi:predicted  nucleic acid-binding Zn-ribbon protein
VAQNKITEQQAKIFFEKLDSPNDKEAEDAFKKLKEFLDSNNVKFSDWIKDKGDLSDLKSKFETASEKNRRLKGKIKPLEDRYSSLKAELNSI